MVMPANHSSAIVHYWAGRYPGKIGWLIGPSAMPKTKMRDWMPFALDNDAFSAWSKRVDWSEEVWRKMLDMVRRSKLEPLWALVPDVVANREKTLEKWEAFSPVVASYGWSMAFAVQDGMTTADVPKDADVVFVGGTTKWKWGTVKTWVKNFPRVHVGRVNSVDALLLCEKLGVESVDGTGWFRDSEHSGKAVKLKNWMENKIISQPLLGPEFE